MRCTLWGEMPADRIVVEGKVQGVGFRAFTVRRAALFGIAGRVWNRADGAVEIFAIHPEDGTLEAFALSLETGPGKVRAVHRERAEELGIEPLGFSVAAG